MMFEGKVAVVTGGAHGIGRAIADAFVKAQLLISLTNSAAIGSSAMYPIKRRWNGSPNLLFRKTVTWII